jgi:hypothetical protein
MTLLLILLALYLAVGGLCLAALWLYGWTQGDTKIDRATALQAVFGWPYLAWKLWGPK